MAFNDKAVYEVRDLDGDSFTVTFETIVAAPFRREDMDTETLHEMGLCCNLNVGESRTDMDGDVWTRVS